MGITLFLAIAGAVLSVLSFFPLVGGLMALLSKLSLLASLGWGVFEIVKAKRNKLPITYKAPVGMLVSALFLFFPAMSGISLSPKPSEPVVTVVPSQPEPPAAPVKIEYTDVTPNQIYQDFKNNPVRASDDYQDKTIRITDTIESINKDTLNDRYTVYFVASKASLLEGVYCSFSLDKADTIKKLNVGDVVKIIGTTPKSSSLGGVELKDCDLFQ